MRSSAMKTISLPGSALSSPAARGLPISGGIYRIPALDRYPELLHGISTRSTPDGDDWNLSSKRGVPRQPPSWARAIASREKLAQCLGISPDNMVGCQQVHGDVVAVVTASDGGRGMSERFPPVEGADAMVTDTRGLYLLSLSADCPPVFLYDPVRHAIGLAHSGWKGTVARIAARTTQAMTDNFASQPSDIVAAIGPGIGPCCYAVGLNVAQAVESAFPYAWRAREHSPALLELDGETIYFNLWQAIRQALLDTGVQARNISIESVCTAHHNAVFYSHRAEAGQCGLFGAVLGMKLHSPDVLLV